MKDAKYLRLLIAGGPWKQCKPSHYCLLINLLEINEEELDCDLSKLYALSQGGNRHAILFW